MYYFIVNPHSRSGKGSLVWQKIQAELERRHISYQCVMTERIGHALEISREISRKGTVEEPVRLIALGGDGTIQEILTGICDLRTVVFGFIPVGSGNDFCRGVRLPEDPMAVLELILSGNSIRMVDVPVNRLSDGTKWRFGISTGTGFDADVCHEVMFAPQKRILNRLKLGRFVYLFIALKQLFSRKPLNARLYIDDKEAVTFSRMYFCAVMNLPFEGGGFKFCPDAKLDDGLLDVIVAEGMPKLLMLLRLPSCFWGGHTHVQGIHLYQCRRIGIVCMEPAAVHLDGEARGFHNHMEVALEKDMIRMFLP